jgi:uncharacterized protein YprB with RNaseH-like and TPR domain
MFIATRLDNLLLIDIETVPLVKSYTELSESHQQLWNRKSLLLDKESEDFEKTFEEKAGIYAEFGKIICIGVGYFILENGKHVLRVKTLSNVDEKKLLSEFTTLVNTFFKKQIKQFCGHNIKEFDIPYLCRRLLINGIMMPDILDDFQNKKPWETPILDTLQLWKFGDYKHYISVALLAEVLHIDTPKDDIDGSDVARVYWQENNLERIATYCGKDVITIAQVLLKLKGLPLLQKNDIALL